MSIQRTRRKQKLEIAGAFEARWVAVGCALTICLIGSSALAAPRTQLMNLTQGWNAVFLEVQPADDSPDVVFSDATMGGNAARLQSVWRWNPRTDTVEFIQDPSTLMPGEPQWMAYYPGDPSVSNLHAIQGETAYLVHLSAGSDVTWEVEESEPTVPHIDWRPNSFNFVGFHLTPGAEPLFDAFFSSALPHAGQQIYRLMSDAWVEVTDPSIPMRSGEAFWVYSLGHSEFVGTLAVQIPQGGGLFYGETLVEQELRIRNDGAEIKHVTLAEPTGAPQLHLWRFLPPVSPTDGVAEWLELATATPGERTFHIAPGETQTLRLGARRAGIAAGVEAAANVALTDTEGSTVLLPAAVTGVSNRGLWVGDATIRAVSEANEGASTSCGEVKPTGSDFSFRLIVHLDESDQARLLREVVQLWQEGTWKPDPNDLEKPIPDQPGHLVLLANDALLHLPTYSGASLRDGQPVGRRISSPAFGFHLGQEGAGGSNPWTASPWDLTGTFGLGGVLRTNLVVPADNPTNPFRHRYHRDHDAADEYQIQRNIELEFSDVDASVAPGMSFLSFGSSEVGGLYTETFTGLHKNQICAEGTFHLRRASDVAELLQ